MKEVITSRILRTIALLIAVCFVGFPTQAQYGGQRKSRRAVSNLQSAAAKDNLQYSPCPEPSDETHVENICYDPRNYGALGFSPIF